MLYCYLSDTALLSFNFSDDRNSTTYGQFLSNGFGTGQVTDRVMSVFNNDLAEDKTTGLIIDPRTSMVENELLKNNRKAGLFTCDDGSPTQVDNYKACGQMCLHYDPTLNYNKNGDVLNDADRILDEDISRAELICLFDIIETCAHTHIYDLGREAYIYPAKSVIESKISRYKYTSQSRTITAGDSRSYGYVPGSLKMPLFDTADYSDNKYASKVKFQSVANNKVTTNNYSTTGDLLSTAKPVYFAKYFEFDFMFANKQEDRNNPVKTTFRIFLDPETLLSLYGECTIRKIIFPVHPQLIANHEEFGTSINDAIVQASLYVGDTLSNEVTAETSIPDILLRENYTGASTLLLPFNGELNGDAVNMTVTCLYRGCVPSKEKMREAIIKFFNTNYPAFDIDSIIPALTSSAKYIVIPLYDTKVSYNVGLDPNDTTLQHTICKNIVPLIAFERCITMLSSFPELATDQATVLNISGFNMHALAIPVKDTEQDPPALSELSNFAKYQAISTTSDYWESLTYSEKELNMRLAAIATTELSGNTTAIRNPQFGITEITTTIGGRDCRCYNFVILDDSTSVDFTVIRLSSYNNVFSLIEG